MLIASAELANTRVLLTEKGSKRVCSISTMSHAQALSNVGDNLPKYLPSRSERSIVNMEGKLHHGQSCKEPDRHV